MDMRTVPIIPNVRGRIRNVLSKEILFPLMEKYWHAQRQIAKEMNSVCIHMKIFLHMWWDILHPVSAGWNKV